MQHYLETEPFETAMRDLVGVALRSLDHLSGGVSVSQFRLMLVLHETGTQSCAAVARALGVAASSVTRGADRLVAIGHVRRAADPSHRGIVALELTPTGEVVVAEVLERRRNELEIALEHLDPALRATTAAGLSQLHRHLNPAGVAGRHPVAAL